MKYALGAASMATVAVGATVALALPFLPSAAPASDEPVALQGPFTWTQQRGAFGAVVQGTLKLRILPAAGTFTCFLTGQGQLKGQQKIGPTSTRIDGNVSMAAGTCSGSYDRVTGKLAGNAKLRVQTRGTTTVHIAAEGAKQEHVQPIQADATDALMLVGTVSGGSAQGTATYSKGGSFHWEATGSAGAVPTSVPPPAPPPAATAPPPSPPTAPPPGGLPPRTKGHAPMPQTEIDKLGAKKQADQQKLDQTLAAVTKNQEFVQGLDESAAKGVNEALKNALELAAKLIDQAQKGASGEGPGAATKTFETLDKLNKVKELISDLREVRDSMAKVDADVKAGKYNENRGNILKGTAVLGKTIKVVVDKVPVVGWAGGEVVDKTFGTVIKVATTRAETGTRWDCCYADPASDCCFGD